MKEPTHVMFIAEYYNEIGQIYRAYTTIRYEPWVRDILIGTEVEVDRVGSGWKSKPFKISRIDPPNPIISENIMFVYLGEV